jgi:Flp pilus assembly protein TadG
MSGVRNEQGQAIVLSVFLTTALLGFAALVIDAGAWFRASRSTQAVADAAALAGVQDLPGDTVTAKSDALSNASKNGGGVASGDVTFESGVRPSDTIVVTARKTEQGFFSKLFGIDNVNVAVTAKARAYTLAQAEAVAPFVVERDHPMLAGNGCPCFNQNTTIVQQGAGPGSFEIVNLDNKKGGNSPGILANWILNGYPGDLGLGWYYSDPGAKFNSSQVKSAMDARLNTTILLPVYDAIQGNGANLQYHIIGWAAYYLTYWDAHGPQAILGGYFQKVTWDGIQDTSGSGFDFGVHSVSLIQ